MKLSTRFRLWLRRRGWKGTIENQENNLREFVYLDDLSVYSLIGSRLGSITTELVETQSSSLQKDFSASGGGTSGVAKVDVGYRRIDQHAQEKQVFRKAIVQTTFKELYDLVKDTLVIRLVNEVPELSNIGTVADLLTAKNLLAEAGWIVDPKQLTRGRLFEIEIQLEAEPIFHMSSITSTYLDILRENPKLFEVNHGNEIIQVESVDRLLEKLLVGLVPIRGRAKDYLVAELEGQEYIVHSSLIHNLQKTTEIATHPLIFVGVAEKENFWRDTRRVLYSKTHFRAFCRLEQDGLKESWTSVKLADVFEPIIPGLSDQINGVGSGALQSITRDGSSDFHSAQKTQLVEDALTIYASLIAGHQKINFSPSELDQIRMTASQHSKNFSTLEERRKAFEEVTTFLHEHFNVEWKASEMSKYRNVALAEAGLDYLGQPVMKIVQEEKQLSDEPHAKFLETEFVAIYW